MTPADIWAHQINGQSAADRLMEADIQSDNVENSFGSLQAAVAANGAKLDALTTKVNQILAILEA